MSLAAVDRNISILIVDDFPTMRRVLKTCLKQLGFENTVEAENGSDALSKLQSGEFQLILSDWNMPEMMGIDFLRAVKADERFSDIPFVMITSETKKETAAEAVNEGAASSLMKPFNSSALGSTLGEIFSQQD